MNRESIGDAEREGRLNEVLLAYVEGLEAGREEDRGQLLAAHPDLRDDLEAFFISHDAMERLAAPLREAGAGGPAGEEASNAEAPVGVGRLGDFRLFAEVGRGGMGVVYEAEQLSLRRRVALKVLSFAAALDPRRLQRFKNEALAAAQLRHENIVPVYAVGCERGVHFYAMQFIEGRSLASLIAELRREQGDNTGGANPLPAAAAETPHCRGWPAHRRVAFPRAGRGRPPLLRLGRRSDPTGRVGAGVRPPTRRRPPRHKAGQPPPGRAGPTLGCRFRPGAGRRRRRPYPNGRAARHSALRQSRAGPGAAGRGGPPQRRLCAGGDPL